jgi:hypothetical protein
MGAPSKGNQYQSGTLGEANRESGIGIRMELKSRRYTVPDLAGAMELCYTNGWTDGFPVVHRNVETTMVYTHVMRHNLKKVRSPVDLFSHNSPKFLVPAPMPVLVVPCLAFRSSMGVRFSLILGRSRYERFWPTAALGGWCRKAAIGQMCGVCHRPLSGNNPNSHSRPGADLQP